MTTFKVMLLSEVTDQALLQDPNKLYQIKENGIRAVGHVKNHYLTAIRNRSNLPILHLFPELKDIRFEFDTGIVDGEICVFQGDKSIYYGGIDQRRSIPDEKKLAEFPVRFVLFDTIFIDGKNLIMKPYSERHRLLKESIQDSSKVSVAANWRDGQELWNKVVTDNLEGVVIKNPMAMYEVGTRSQAYQKLKYYKYGEVVVDRVEPNDKGTKVFGKMEMSDRVIDVEVQLAGVFNVEPGQRHRIKYLDIAGDRLIQPTISHS